jgi:ADP-dependent NAD(P)H-hydrate dehydratase / NAD(P)H-hydrate epimerase
MAGAAIVATEAALRAGAGYVRLVSPESNRAILQAVVPEAVYVDAEDEDGVRVAMESADALLVGPGLGRDDSARDRLDRVLTASPGTPTLLDADALTLLAAESDRLADLASERPLVLTPHPGEMARLTGAETAAIVASPLEAARALAERLGCTVLLKGAPSVVAAPGEPTLIATLHSSDLAKAGMGDQLAGTIAAFLAAGASTRDAAGLGLFYSGRAAVLAGRGRSLGPRDVSAHLDRALADPGPLRSPLGLPFVTFDQPPRW